MFACACRQRSRRGRAYTEEEYLESFVKRLNSMAVDEEEWEEIAIKSKFLSSKLDLLVNNLKENYLLNKSYYLEPSRTSELENLLGSLKSKKVCFNDL